MKSKYNFKNKVTQSHVYKINIMQKVYQVKSSCMNRIDKDFNCSVISFTVKRNKILLE